MAQHVFGGDNRRGPDPETRGPMVVSVAAGVDSDYIAEQLGEHGDDVPIIRCMPSIAVSRGSGSMVWHGNEHVDTMDRLFLRSAFHGPQHTWVQDENLLDVATVLVGSQPAFQSVISQVWIDFATSHGFDPYVATRVYAAAVKGTARIMMEERFTPAEIIEEVATPKGMTRAGIDHLLSSDVQRVLREAAEVSLKRVDDIRKKLAP